jgi:hypothetical protein
MQVVLIDVNHLLLVIGVLPRDGPTACAGLIPPDRALKVTVVQLTRPSKWIEPAFVDLIHHFLNAEADIFPLHFVNEWYAVRNGWERFVDFQFAGRIHAENRGELPLDWIKDRNAILLTAFHHPLNFITQCRTHRRGPKAPGMSKSVDAPRRECA